MDIFKEISSTDLSDQNSVKLAEQKLASVSDEQLRFLHLRFGGHSGNKEYQTVLACVQTEQVRRQNETQVKLAKRTVIWSASTGIAGVILGSVLQWLLG